MRELCTGYGQVDIMWFDMAGGVDWETEKLVKMIRQLQPRIIIDDRLGGAYGDFSTHEQGIGGFEVERPWETCMTICRQWSWKPNDKLKTAKESLEILVRVASADGNLLFNVGPMPTGEIEPRQVKVLNEMGQWLDKNGKSVYGTRGGPFKGNAWVTMTNKGNTIYVHVLRWYTDMITLPLAERKIVASSVLTGGTVTVKQHDGVAEISVPAHHRQDIDTIVVLELDGPADELEAKAIPLGTWCEGKSATASKYSHERHDPSKAVDGNSGTLWVVPGEEQLAWLEVDLGARKTFDRTFISEAGGQIRRYALQMKENGSWRNFHQGTTVGEELFVEFAPVTGRYIRLHLAEKAEDKSRTMIREFHVWQPQPSE